MSAHSTPPAAALSVWPTAQHAAATQRRGRYVTTAVAAHPAKMLPAIAAHAITHYTRPGDLVLDPMCGIGTTLVEAIHQGRPAIGVEYEPRWASVTQANLDLAAQHGAPATGQVITGDARHLTTLLPAKHAGQVALIVTSPPYGPSVHGQVRTLPGAGIHKRDNQYGHPLDRGQLANIGHYRLLTGLTRILANCLPLLRPGGHVVITIRPWREHAELIDLPSQIHACGIRAGLNPVERCVALLARITDDNTLTPRASFFQRNNIVKQRAAGLPLHLIAHEDVLVFRAPGGVAELATKATTGPAASGGDT